MSELTKLETMFYHMRDAKHRQFLETHEQYAWFRTVNTFKGGKLIIDTDSLIRNQKQLRNQGRTIPTANSDNLE